MRVLHVILTPRHSGAEMLVRDLAALHTASGLEVGVFACAPADMDFQGEITRSRSLGVSWFVPDKPLMHSNRLLPIRRCVREFAPDVIVTHCIMPAIYTRVALFGMRNKPQLVSVLHDSSCDDYAILAKRRLAWIESLLKSRTDAIVAVNPLQLVNYSRRFGDSQNRVVIKNGIDLSSFQRTTTERAAAREALGIRPEDCIAIQIGRISNVKRQTISLKAMVPLLASDENLQLWFAGVEEDPAVMSQLRQIASEQPHKRVHFLARAETWLPFLPRLIYT